MRSKLYMVIFQVLAWVVAFNLFFFFKFWGVDVVELNFAKIFPFPANAVYYAGTVLGVAVGLFLGWFDILMRYMKFTDKTLGYILLVRSIFCVFIIFIVIYAVYLSGCWMTECSAYDMFRNALLFFSNPIAQLLVLYSLIFSTFINLMTQFARKFGVDDFFGLLFGKYSRPIEEERIFMFLDLKSSTTYAEKLGHIQYSELIQDCFKDLNTLADKYKANIYQYVGDEVVFTWKINFDKTELNHNSLFLFYAFQIRLSRKTDYYTNRYGFVPEFKAGINAGKVTATEVGEIKREIAYHGDVLNTASRVQGLCNVHAKNLLITEDFLNLVDLPYNYKPEFMGVHLLKGKNKVVKVYSIEQK